MAKRITDKDILMAKEKYKSMNKKEKISYIFEYYKFHIIGILLAVILVGSIINTTIINPPKKSGLSLTFIDAPVDETSLSEHIPIFNDMFIEDKEKYEVTTNLYYLQSDDVQYTSANMQRFAAQIQIGELDIVVAYKETFNTYAEHGVFYNLDNIPEIASGAYNKEYIQSEDDTEKKAYGINIAEFKLFEELGFYPDEFIMGIIVNSQNIDLSVDFIEYALTGSK